MKKVWILNKSTYLGGDFVEYEKLPSYNAMIFKYPFVWDKEYFWKMVSEESK